ncbi:hypothetical protein Fmac_008172 [Flemingia macrophylla]|uniref:Uncharacterized protein n=1 Tax=Flemingia macrophylla TaxID=520843 RepID=A0ABD1MXI8_9FABA
MEYSSRKLNVDMDSKRCDSVGGLVDSSAIWITIDSCLCSRQTARDKRPEDWVPEEAPYFQQVSHENIDCSEIKHVDEDNGQTIDIFSIHSEDHTALASGTSWPDLVASKIAAERQKTADSAITNITCRSSIPIFTSFLLLEMIACYR